MKSGSCETTSLLRRCRVRVRGIVQGVGFRPHVFLLAKKYDLSGWVCNDGMGVVLEIQGNTSAIDAFVVDLKRECPAMARIDAVEAEDISLDHTQNAKFVIQESRSTRVATVISPDAGMCPDCRRELLEPGDRRYLYPFLNCTHCGPRYTIIRKLPYDRSRTCMASFPMCEPCREEYHNPLDRRFHAQPTACPVCGPQLSMPVPEIVMRLRQGEIVAIKGLGGFHLACDATNEAAVARLRERKNRDAKPFALMVANLPSARKLVEIDEPAAVQLEARTRPIVLLPQQQTPWESVRLAPSLAPGMRSLGVMLPYTPLQELLFFEAAGKPSFENYAGNAHPFVLVMTSANPGGEPLVIGNDEAHERLSGIADAVVTHNRDIVVRVDDSVIQMFWGRPAFVRRARGYAPDAIKLPRALPSVIAFGADLKNTICITRGDEAFVSQHLGDLDNAATLDFVRETVAHLTEVLNIKPQAVVCDLHPDFFSHKLACEMGLPRVEVQHHHAHVAAVVAEQHLQGPVLGVALDGFGLGPDRGSWGGELLWVEGCRYERIGHLRTLKEPGADKAAREPWRMAAAALFGMGAEDSIPAHLARLGKAAFAPFVTDMMKKGLNSPDTSSCGRLFDAACGLLGVQPVASFEGQAPMLLEALVTEPEVLAGGFVLRPDFVLDFYPLLAFLAAHYDDSVRGANLFHGTLIAGLAEWISAAAAVQSVKQVALAGGCFLNRVLAEGLMAELQKKGLAAFLPRALPPNDGGISLGQAWLGALSLV